VQGAKKQGAEFDRVGRIGHLGRFEEQFGGSLADKSYRGQVDPFEHAEHGLAIRMGARIVRGFRTPGVAFSKPARHEFDIAFGSPALAKEHQAVLGDGKVPDLPSKMGRGSLRLALPEFLGNVCKKSQGVFSGEFHLPNGRIPHGDGRIGRGNGDWNFHKKYFDS